MLFVPLNEEILFPIPMETKENEGASRLALDETLLGEGIFRDLIRSIVSSLPAGLNEKLAPQASMTKEVEAAWEKVDVLFGSVAAKLLYAKLKDKERKRSESTSWRRDDIFSRLVCLHNCSITLSF